MTTESRQVLLETTRTQAHGRCAVCGHVNGDTPRLRFAVAADGSVQATFQPDHAYEGYAGILHGGVIATLLDAAMTNCLFAHGRCGLTAELNVRFRHPVRTGRRTIIRAWVERDAAPLFVLRAEASQDGQRRATATGKFLTPAVMPWENGNRGIDQHACINGHCDGQDDAPQRRKGEHT